ncbi:hypothetical protein Tco_1351350 [Tanacetum coccineum]
MFVNLLVSSLFIQGDNWFYFQMQCLDIKDPKEEDTLSSLYYVVPSLQTNMKTMSIILGQIAKMDAKLFDCGVVREGPKDELTHVSIMVESIKKISENVAWLSGVSKGHGEWQFNQMLFKDLIDGDGICGLRKCHMIFVARTFKSFSKDEVFMYLGENLKLTPQSMSEKAVALDELQEMHQQDSYSPQSLHNPNDSEKSLTELNNDLKNDLEDFKRYIRSMRTVHDKHFTRDDGKTTGVLPQSKTDFEKSITKLLDRQRVTNMFFKNNVNDMILKIKQIENNFQTKIKNMKRKIDEWEKSQNISSEHTKRTDPPPPQAYTEHVNVVFTGSGKSADSPKIQTLPPIIVEDKPIKTSNSGYHVVKINEYLFREYIPKTPYPQRLNVDHSHLNRIVKVS